MKFRKKPVVIEAVQFFERLAESGQEFPGVERIVDTEHSSIPNVYYAIKTLEGELVVSEGDWIITGVKGENYPCKPDIFEATYDPC